MKLGLEKFKKQTPDNDDSDFGKVKGWLAIVVFTLFAGTTNNCFVFYTEAKGSLDLAGEQWRDVLLYEFWLYSFLIITGIIAIIQILRHRLSGKYWALTAIIGSVIGIFILYLMLPGVQREEFMQIQDNNFFRDKIVHSIALVAYLLFSKRVKKTLIK